MGKILLLAVIFIGVFTLSPLVWAAFNRPLLVLDMRNSPEMPRHFRTTSDPIDNSGDLNLTGFIDLHMIGSAQFSKLQLEKILQKRKLKNITIVDLREESHGFLNGNAISWFGPHNASNAGMKPSKIEKNQYKLLSGLEKQNLVRVFRILKRTPDEKIERVEPVDFSVHQIASEEEFIAANQLEYKRIYVQDYHAPRTNQVDRFVQLVKTLPAKSWIYFHCRAGIGRSSTFMVMYDMMRNAKHVSFDDILARQLAIGGKDFRKLPSPGTYKYEFALARVDFLKKFYAYAYSNTDNFRTSWKEWLKNNNH